MTTEETRTGEPRGTVLCIEDSAINMAFVEGVLADMTGISLIKATTGAEGIALARSERPDLVLLDMHLPDLDGVEVLARLRADTGTHALTVIALSASAMPEDLAAARAAGADAYWTKPLDFAQFLRHTGRLLQLQRRVPLDA